MKKVQIDDFGKMNFLSDLSVSPDGKALAFVCSQANVKENKYNSSIWIMENGKCRKLTTGGSESGPMWLDEEHILFPGDRKKAHKPAPGQAVTVYNVINIHGGEAEEFFTVPMRCTKLKKIKDGEYLLTATYDHYGIDLAGLEGEEKAAAIAQIEENKDYEIFDELPFWVNGSGVVNKKRNRLYRFEQESGELTLISPEWMNVGGFDYDKAGDRVVYYGSDYQWMDERKTDMYVCPVHGGRMDQAAQGDADVIDNQVQIQLNGRFSVNSAVWAGGSIFFSASDGMRYGTAENPCQFIADPVSGQWGQIADLDCSMHSSVGSDCRRGGGSSSKVIDGNWYFSSTRGFNTAIVKLSADGEEKIISPEIRGSIDCWDYYDGKFYCVGMREGGLQEIYCFTEGSETEEKLTSFNDEFMKTHEISPLKYLGFVDRDGVQIDGWVIEPVGYDPEKSYPAILDVHGGPKTVYGEVFFHEMQLWASEGYFVFFCNPRGGDGKGNEFADIAGPNYGVKDYNDLMEFTDKVLEAYPQIDKTRVGMTGGSYGGFMANWIVGHTDRFAAVASQRSISNFISKCLTTDIGYYHNLSAVQSDPWSSPEEMWNRSPLKYADKCVTPTLFIQSDEDYRCWMADAIQMFTALRMHGCPTRLCLFHGENHELSRNGKPKHRVRRLKEITDWFNTYLKQEEN